MAKTLASHTLNRTINNSLAGAMIGRLEGSERDWVDISLALSHAEVDSLIALLEELKNEDLGHIHLTATDFGADTGVANVEFSIKGDQEPDDMRNKGNKGQEDYFNIRLATRQAQIDKDYSLIDYLADDIYQTHLFGSNRWFLVCLPIYTSFCCLGRH